MPTKYAKSGFSVLAALILACGFAGCGYGEVSGKTYDCAKAMYSICNRKDEARLPQITTLVAELQSTEQISGREAKWLLNMVDQAKAGKWETAAADAREMMMDQVRD